MRLMGSLRAGGVAGTVGWTLMALTVLPAALCCRAAMVDETRREPAAHACCTGGRHGAACPLRRDAVAPSTAAHEAHRALAAADAQIPRSERAGQVRGCDPIADALAGLLGQTAYVTATDVPPARLTRAGRIALADDTAVSLDGRPHAPPPRV